MIADGLTASVDVTNSGTCACTDTVITAAGGAFTGTGTCFGGSHTYTLECETTLDMFGVTVRWLLTISGPTVSGAAYLGVSGPCMIGTVFTVPCDAGLTVVVTLPAELCDYMPCSAPP